MENGYTYWREMDIMSEMVKETTFAVSCKPIMTKRSLEELQEKLKQQKVEYERMYGKSLSEERKRLMVK